AAQRARLEAERQRLLNLAPPDVLTDFVEANSRHTRLQASIRDLQDGHTRWRGSDAGDTAYQLKQAGRRRREAEQLASDRSRSWRDRRYWRGQARHWTETT